VILAIGIAEPTLARAEDDTAKAEALFQEGRKLVEEKRYGEACPKFAASHKLAPAVGTLLNLGDCYQRAGLYASAWLRFVDAIGLAQKLNRPDRERAARDRAMLVEPKLTRVTITAKDAVIEVKKDGVVLDEGSLGTAIPVDPGNHVIEARARGKKAYVHPFVVTDEAQQLRIAIPALGPGDGKDDPPLPPPVVKEPPKKEPPRKEPPPPPPEKRSPLRTVGVVVAGAGVVGVGVGTFFGLRAMSKWNDSKKTCDATGCDAAGYVSGTDAKGAGTVSTIGFVAGGALLVGGAVMFFVSPSGEAKRAGTPGEGGVVVGVAPSIDPAAPGFLATGRF
jgi:hypothetical protein